MIAIVQAFVGFYYSDAIALSVSHAEEAPREEFLDLHRVVENLSITAGIPKPKIYVINETFREIVASSKILVGFRGNRYFCYCGRSSRRR